MSDFIWPESVEIAGMVTSDGDPLYAVTFEGPGNGDSGFARHTATVMFTPHALREMLNDLRDALEANGGQL